MSAQFLDSAMAGLTLQTSNAYQRSSVAGLQTTEPSLGMHFLGPPLGQVQIRWKPILLDVVQKLGGTEPVYNCQNTTDGTRQISVFVTFPPSSTGSYSKDIAVLGPKCSSFCEAENEASIAALKDLEHGYLGIRIMDVSALRCRELEQQCYESLVKADNLYHAVKSVISEWQEDMYKTEIAYSPNRNTAEAHSPGDVCPALAEYLFDMMSERNLKMQELIAETERIKICTDKVCGRVEQLFGEQPSYQLSKHQGGLPLEIQISMNIVLEQMMLALGWAMPKYDITNSAMGGYVCETTLFPIQEDKLNILGPDSLTKEIAVQSSCKVAIGFLESDKSIWLADLNLNHRLHRELHAVESKKVMESLYFMGSKALGEWKSMYDELVRCKDKCNEVMLNCSREQLALWCKMRKNANALNGLEKFYLVDIQAAEQRFKNAGWNWE